MTSDDNPTTTIAVDEDELMACIRALVVASTENDDAGNEAVELLADETILTSADSSSSNQQHHQGLVQQVEEKLTHFLEDQLRRNDRTDCQLDPTDNRADPKIVLPIHKAHAYLCRATHKALPSPPMNWPQRYVAIGRQLNSTLFNKIYSPSSIFRCLSRSKQTTDPSCSVPLPTRRRKFVVFVMRPIVIIGISRVFVQDAFYPSIRAMNQPENRWLWILNPIILSVPC